MKKILKKFNSAGSLLDYFCGWIFYCFGFRFAVGVLVSRFACGNDYR